MFAAAISLVGLAATVYLVLREAKAIRAQSGTVAKSALGWSVAFGLFQLFLTIWGAIGLVAQNVFYRRSGTSSSRSTQSCTSTVENSVSVLRMTTLESPALMTSRRHMAQEVAS